MDSRDAEMRRNGDAEKPVAALFTPHGRGAVATIQLCGNVTLLDDPPPSLFAAANGKPLATQPLDRVIFGRWGAGDESHPAEEVVVCRKATDTVEIHCHGGDAAAARILADLEHRGCAIVSAIDFVSRETSTLDAECLDALSRAVTLRTAAILLDQQQGTLRTAFEKLRAKLLRAETLDSRLSTLDCPDLHELLRWTNFGLHLTQPWRVVLAGRPNVGKSSLINALVGYERSIVFDEPGTTRDVVTAETALDGWPIQFVDTAGLRDTDGNELESAGIELARRQLEDADLRLIVFDVSQPPTSVDEQLLSDWPDAIAVANKCDLPNAWGDRFPAFATRVSALQGTGLEELRKLISGLLVLDRPYPGAAVPITSRQARLLCHVAVAMVNDDRSLALQLCDELLA